MTFASLPDRRAIAAPHGPAVSDSRTVLTNADFLDRVRAASARLAELGVGSGDVVAVALPNSAEFVVLLFAAWRRGAAVTPVNPASTPHEVDRQVRDSHAKVLVVVDESSCTQLSSDIATPAVSDFARHGSADTTPPVDDASALALVIYTSGTTGSPKGVMLDQANIVAMSDMTCGALQLTDLDRCLLVLPLFHVNGIVVSVLSSLAAGGSVVIADRFDPAVFFDDVEKHRPTYFSAVPTILGMLAALPASHRPDTTSVRFAACGAAPAPVDLLERFQARYTIPVIEGYGLSEGTCASTLNPIDGRRRAGTVGIALPGQDVRIVNSEGTPLAPGQPGEVVVRGPNVMRGYLGRPDDTARTIVDDWLHTGDVGVLDTEGYLTLIGRSKDLIIRGGENIYPKEIEDVLTSDPSVAAAAVLGAPDERWGEVVVAFVEPEPGADIDISVLEAVCRRTLSRFKRPSDITVVPALPRNAVGKIDKKVLRPESAPHR